MFTEIEKERLVRNISTLMLVKADRAGVFTLPFSAGFISPEAGVCNLGFVETSKDLPVTFENGVPTLSIPKSAKGRFIAVYQK